MKKILCLLLTALAALSMASCGSEAAAEATTPTVCTEPQYFQTYLTADPTSMDISRVSDSYSSSIITQVMDSLVRLEEAGGSYVINAGDAQTWQSNADGTVWTFYLGDNKWSDGQEVTAQDYVYSLRRSADPATECPNEYFLEPLTGYADVRAGAPLETLGAKALDDKTLEITLAYPVPSFLEMCSGTIYYPIRQDYVERFGDRYGTAPGTFIGNGAYTMEHWSRNDSITLKKSETYWNAQNVQIETVNIAILPDSDAAYALYESGDLDYVSTTTDEWVDRFTAREDTNYVQTPTAAVNFSFYNTSDPLLGNVNIRKAFTLATDRSDLNETCFGGKNIPADGWISPAMAVGPTVYREQAGSVIQSLLQEADAADMTARDYLLTGMAELGLGTDPASLDLTLSLSGSDQRIHTFGSYLQQACREALGVELKLDFKDWNTFYRNVQQGSYQIGYMSWEAYYNDPYDLLSLFLSEIDAIHTGWSSPEYDRLVKEARITMDEERRIVMYKAAEDLLVKDACVINPMIFATRNSFYRDYVEGYPTLAFTNTGYKGMRTEGR